MTQLEILEQTISNINGLLENVKTIKNDILSKSGYLSELEKFVLEHPLLNNTQDAIYAIRTLQYLINISLKQHTNEYRCVLRCACNHLEIVVGNWQNDLIEATLRNLENKPNQAEKNAQYVEEQRYQFQWIEERLQCSDSYDAIINRSLLEIKVPRLWSEEDESIRMLDWYTIAKNQDLSTVDPRRLCDFAHPLMTYLDGTGKQQRSIILRSLAQQCNSLVDTLHRLDNQHVFLVNKRSETNLAKELLRSQTMKLWKAVKVSKLVCFTEKGII